jgi:1-acyl-sn-glycerol-3-phosphate acyltransferase
MHHRLRLLFFLCVIRPLVMIVLGLNVRRRERLPAKGPCIVVANHNSHLDAMVLMSLFPLAQLRLLRPVAAADYFLRGKLLRWFALRIVGILPIPRERKEGGERDPLRVIDESLEAGQIVLLFPEGSRGEPEELDRFKTGVAHLARRHPDVPVTPIFLHGLGKALPRGEAILVPFFCDVFVGEPFRWSGDRAGFMGELEQRMQALAAEGKFPVWK